MTVPMIRDVAMLFSGLQFYLCRRAAHDSL
jgi:hypothetical protein